MITRAIGSLWGRATNETVPAITTCMQGTVATCPSGRRFLTSIVTFALLLATANKAHASLIDRTTDGNTVATSCGSRYDPLADYFFCVVDPVDIVAFQLDYRFDPSRWQFQGIEYISPYVQSGAPDLSLLSSGLIQDIAGVSSISPPPSGEVFLFSISFQGLQPGALLTPFTVFASSNDFVVGFDTDTGENVTIGPDQIAPATCIPEPGTLLLLATGVAAVATLSKPSREAT